MLCRSGRRISHAIVPAVRAGRRPSGQHDLLSLRLSLSVAVKHCSLHWSKLVTHGTGESGSILKAGLILVWQYAHADGQAEVEVDCDWRRGVRLWTGSKTCLVR